MPSSCQYKQDLQQNNMSPLHNLFGELNQASYKVYGLIERYDSHAGDLSQGPYTGR